MVGAAQDGDVAGLHADRLVVVHEAVQWQDIRIEDRHPGKIWKLHEDGPVVVCGTGLVQIRRWDGPPIDRLKVRLGA